MCVLRGVPRVLAEAADCEAERKQLMSGALSVLSRIRYDLLCIVSKIVTISTLQGYYEIK